MPDDPTMPGSWLVWDKAADEQQEAADHALDPFVDMESNELRAGEGRICPICDRVISHGQFVRKRVDGSYQHEDCPPH
jgi:hypothetical protein